MLVYIIWKGNQVFVPKKDRRYNLYNVGGYYTMIIKSMSILLNLKTLTAVCLPSHLSMPFCVSVWTPLTTHRRQSQMACVPPLFSMPSHFSYIYFYNLYKHSLISINWGTYNFNTILTYLETIIKSNEHQTLRWFNIINKLLKTIL